MRDGELWFDKHEGRTETEKIERAAQWYSTKHGERPTVVFVHPTARLDGDIVIEGIEVRYTNSVLENHYWLGHLKGRE